MDKSKNESGAAMALVMIVIMVFSILGTAIWYFSMTEGRQAVTDQYLNKAYYLARTGAETAYAAWGAEKLAHKPNGDAQRVYLNNQSGEYEQDKPADSGGYFDVNISVIDDPGDEKNGFTRITSLGGAEGFTRRVSVYTYPFSYGHHLSPAWYIYDSGSIREYSFVENERYNMVVLTSGPDSLFLGDGFGVFEGYLKAKEIVFQSSLTVHATSTLTVVAETILFNDLSIEADGNLIIVHPDGEDSGKVFFDGVTPDGIMPGDYLFRHNTNLANIIPGDLTDYPDRLALFDYNRPYYWE